MRQVHDANLSDIEEDKDDHASTSRRAPGKENDARAGFLKSREATSSMLKNRSFKTKTDSDTSSDGNATIKKLKEMHLEADKALNFGAQAGDGGARLSAGSSYKPPSVESASGHSSVVGGNVKTYHVSHHDDGYLARASGEDNFEMKDAGLDTADKACQADISSTIRVYLDGPETAASPMQVQQSDSGSRPTTCGTNDSGASRRFPSGTSRTSSASIRFRSRRNPAETSTGSPPERDGLALSGNIGDNIRYKAFGSGTWPQPPAHNGSHEAPSQRTFGGTRQFDGMAGGYANGQKLTDLPLPPTPPRESHWPYTQQQYQNPTHNNYAMNQHEWAPQSSPTSAPKAFGASMDLGKPDGYGAHYSTGGFDPESGAQYANNTGYYGYPHNGFNSAAHFSDAHCRRDFSGDSYYDHGNDQFDYSKPSYPAGGFTQPQQSYQYGGQGESGPKSQYGPQSQYSTQAHYGAQAQYGFQGQPGSWTEYHDNGFSQQDSAFGEDNGYSAPKEFDFSFIGKGNNSAWASNTYVPTSEEINAYMERNFTDPVPQTTTTTSRAEPQWTIYEDEDDGIAGAQQPGGDPQAAGAYAWRDGNTSIHRVGSSTPGNTVTILSIREITSDEDLSGKFDGGCDDNDGMPLDP